MASKEPSYSRFRQQDLPAIRPLFSPTWQIFTFILVGVVFIPLGAICLHHTSSVVEVSYRYDHNCFPADSTPSTNKEREAALMAAGGEGSKCEFQLEVPEKMKATPKNPVYVYYELKGFYQNHRRFVRSRYATQLRKSTEELTEVEIAAAVEVCDPLGEKNATELIVPCGLFAASYFNDTYSISADGVTVPVSDKGLAWSSDIKDKFGHVEPVNFNDDPATRMGGALQKGYLDEDERFIVWMRPAFSSHFRKLWGKIEGGMEPGSILTVTTTNRFNSYGYDGEKTLVLSTASKLGGKNNFLGSAYLGAGCVSIASGLLFFAVHWQNRRESGNLDLLSWNVK